jgi:excisionase family DNA binding protein
MEKLLLKVPEAAAIVGLGQSKFYELIRRGEIPAVHIGRATRVPVEGLRSWVEAQTEDVRNWNAVEVVRTLASSQLGPTQKCAREERERVYRSRPSEVEA